MLTLICRRVQKFRADYTDLRSQFERYKAENIAAVRIYLSFRLAVL